MTPPITDHHRGAGDSGPGVVYRHAGSADADAIAALHADSWRRHYRGAFSDEFLDGPVEKDRRTVWSARLRAPSASATILAELDQRPAGFAHVIFDADRRFGALLDNLHVRHDAKRRGIGGALMAAAARALVAARPTAPMYLWVLEQNLPAQAFYRSIGGQEADRKTDTPPGGGTILGIRYVWPDPRVVFGGRR